MIVVVPTYNEGPNVAELVRRLGDALPDDASVLFVDDSRDDTPQVIESVAATAPLPVRLIHRDEPVGGLSGAVVEGLRAVEAAGADWAVIMDGDLQHPPELVPALVTRGREARLDLVVASRYTGDGDAGGLDGWWRHGRFSASGWKQPPSSCSSRSAKRSKASPWIAPAARFAA